MRRFTVCGKDWLLETGLELVTHELRKGGIMKRRKLSIVARGSGVLAAASVLGLSCTLLSCAQTRQTRSVETKGFLENYSQLQKGEGDDAQLIYINPESDFSKYTKVKIDSVTLWASEELNLKKLSEKEQQALTDGFYHALHSELGKDYQIVETAGPDTMELRAAITEADDANVTLNVITTTVPQLKILSSLGGLATDMAPIVGHAGFEAELIDSESRERLGAAVDKRVGTKTFKGMFSDWSDVDEAFKAWASNLRKRLEKLRDEKDAGR